MSPALVLALVLAAKASAPAPPRPPPPPAPGPSLVGGADEVLLGRLYLKSAGAITPLGRFGMVLSGKATKQALAVGKDASPETGAFTVNVSAHRHHEGAVLAWDLAPTSGSRIAAGKGTLEIKQDSMGHLDLGGSGGASIYASVDVGHASSFAYQRISDHFGGGPTVGASGLVPPAPAQPSVAEGATPPPPTAAPPRPRGTSITVSCPGGSAYDLSLGSAAGHCAVDVASNGVVEGGSCDDGAGNAAEARCHAGCIRTSGSGSCGLR